MMRLFKTVEVNKDIKFVYKYTKVERYLSIF